MTDKEHQELIKELESIDYEDSNYDLKIAKFLLKLEKHISE